MSAVTQWFGPNDAPINIGAYQACGLPQDKDWKMHGYQFWNGEIRRKAV